MIRLLIVSRIRLYREGLAQALAPIDTLDVVAQLSDREATLANLRNTNVDAVVIDMSTAEDHALARDVRATAPGIPIVALGVRESESDILSCVEAGVATYVTHDESLDDLVIAVHNAVRGELVCSPHFAGSLVRRVADLAAERHQDFAETPLTRRECEIGNLLKQNLSNKEIAVRLGIEEATVKNHVHNLLEKLRVHSRTDAARLLHRVLR